MCKSEFTGWAIIEELSIRRRLRTFLISWGQKTHVKHCNVDLSSWYELWFAIICIDMDVILDFYHNPTILETVLIAWVNTENVSHWNTTTWNNSCLCLCKTWKSNVKNIFVISQVGLAKPHGSPRSFQFAQSLTMSAHSRQSERQNIIDRTHTLTAMFGHYIGGYFNN